MVITAPLGGPWRKEPRIGSSEVTDRTGVAVQYDRCRYTLDLRVKVPERDGWVSPVRSIPPPPPPFTGKSIVLKPGETMTFKMSPTPAELSLYTASTRLGPYVPPDLAAKCPGLSGSLWFTPQGVFVDMPWGEGNVVVPGFTASPRRKSRPRVASDLLIVDFHPWNLRPVAGREGAGRPERRAGGP